MVEPEIAFELGADLRGPGITPADVRAATSGLRPCLEVIDSRLSDWRIQLCDTIADNGSSARVVFGDGDPSPLGDHDLIRGRGVAAAERRATGDRDRCRGPR